MLNSKFDQLRAIFNISKPEDWQSIRPEQITAQHGIGSQTLNYLRVLLAMHNLTLKDDRTPDYWRDNLRHVKICDQLGSGSTSDFSLITPFTIFIDSAEQEPFEFVGIRSGAEHKNRTWIPRIEWKSLGRHPDSLGDYSVEGGFGKCHVERKSLSDLHGTLLGFDGRRERFEAELANLSEIEAGCVVVECSFGMAITQVEARGKKSVSAIRRTLYGSIMAYQQDFKVRWAFCDNRKLAEHFTFRWLQRFWEHEVKEQQREVENLVAEL